MGCGTTGKIVDPVPKPHESQVRTRILQIEDFKILSSNFVFHKRGFLLRDYWIGTQLGCGACGHVKRAVHKATGMERAIKTVKRSKLTEDMTKHSQFFTEIDTLRQIDHPNIIKLYEFYENEISYHLVMEQMKGGELLEFLAKHSHLSESIATHFFKQLLKAVAYCHSKDIVHRDLKPKNLLLDSESPHATLKVIDFATSVLLPPTGTLSLTNGSPNYKAPEVLNKEYSSKCDVWSCGVILYIILSGTHPFTGRTDAETARHILQSPVSFSAPVWSSVSSEAKEFIASMLNKDPQARPTALKSLEHPWIVQSNFTPALGHERLLTSLSNLKQFHIDSKLQGAVLSFITNQLLKKEDTSHLYEVFCSIDSNSDGKLSKEELLAACALDKDFDLAEEEVLEIMEAVDIDSNGFIEYSEFITASLQKETLLSKNNLELTFRAFDTDQSGSISQEEIHSLLGPEMLVSDSVWSHLLQEADLNNDGVIDLQEFKDLMLKLF